ncbi:complexin-3-like [Scyliorhinus canicula]|uniref:complexin-3-like n=1 Tax=Scyliorhinus canicula TaxID=7830 RepID=UPI0018F68BAC|nr:complexin-3-like [Scyliorhinus canicula]XP_038643113.1 complexin-3-like [Scyliorhinus canicula]
MNALVKRAFGDSTGQLLCCLTPEADGKGTGFGNAGIFSRDDYQRHLQALEEDRKKRDEEFARRKADRAAMRTCLRAKYQLGQNEKDNQQLRAVGGAAGVPVGLAAIVNVGRRPEGASWFLPEFPSLPDANLAQLPNTAQSAINQLRQTTERQCMLM